MNTDLSKTTVYIYMQCMYILLKDKSQKRTKTENLSNSVVFVTKQDKNYILTCLRE